MSTGAITLHQANAAKAILVHVSMAMSPSVLKGGYDVAESGGAEDARGSARCNVQVGKGQLKAEVGHLLERSDELLALIHATVALADGGRLVMRVDGHRDP